MKTLYWIALGMVIARLVQVLLIWVGLGHWTLTIGDTAAIVCLGCVYLLERELS